MLVFMLQSIFILKQLDLIIHFTTSQHISINFFVTVCKKLNKNLIWTLDHPGCWGQNAIWRVILSFSWVLNISYWQLRFYEIGVRDTRKTDVLLKFNNNILDLGEEWIQICF